MGAPVQGREQCCFCLSLGSIISSPFLHLWFSSSSRGICGLSDWQSSVTWKNLLQPACFVGSCSCRMHPARSWEKSNSVCLVKDTAAQSWYMVDLHTLYIGCGCNWQLLASSVPQCPEMIWSCGYCHCNNALICLLMPVSGRGPLNCRSIFFWLK